MKGLAKQLCPPVLRRRLQAFFRARVPQRGMQFSHGEQQDLDVYWDPHMAEILEQWGEGTAWSEIMLLMANCQGRVLDIACGTGKVMSLLGRFPYLEVHGCDISDMLIGKAMERGILRERLTVSDATAMSYPNHSFDWGYSIGSLEHFSEEGIPKFLSECARVVNGTTFHMIPISRSGKDEGWIKTFQSYHNNSVDWWEIKCRYVYPKVHVLDSRWNDEISVGKWLVCQKY